MTEAARRRVEQPGIGDLRAGEGIGGIGEVERDQLATGLNDGLVGA